MLDSWYLKETLCYGILKQSCTIKLIDGTNHVQLNQRSVLSKPSEASGELESF